MLMRAMLLAVALGLATAASAVEVAGVAVPDKAQVAGRELVLNGAGLRKRAIFKVYVGSLYLPKKARRARPSSRRHRAACSSTCCVTSRRTS